MKLKYLIVTFFLFKGFFGFSQEQIPNEFSRKFDSITTYDAELDKEIKNKIKGEIFFYKNKTLTFEIITEGKSFVLSQSKPVQPLIDTETGEEFRRIFLEDLEGLVYIMDCSDSQKDDIKLYFNVREDSTFDKSYLFYN